MNRNREPFRAAQTGREEGKIFRMIRFAFLLWILTGFSAAGATGSGRAAKLNAQKGKGIVSGLHAEFRNGQVFLIWNEAAGNNSDLRVYISKEPINARNLSSAQLLTDQLEPHSANDWYDDTAECWRAKGPAHGWIIEAGRAPLDRSNGLFVHTVSPRDPSRAYFAVLGAGENPANLRSGINSLKNPVSISTGNIQAIWQSTGSQPVANGKPLMIFLHSHEGRPAGELTQLFFGDSSMGWREGLPFKFKVSIRADAVLLEPFDRVWINRRMSGDEAKANNGMYDTLYHEIESWWYGTNSKINDPVAVSTGTPTNYTERWLLWALDWVQQHYGTDPEKVYAFGASMGTGVLRLVLRNPGRFASVDLLVPILDPFGEGNVGDRMKSRVGAPQSICSDGVELSTRLNTFNAIRSAKTDLPPIVIRVGRTDQSVFWIRKPEFMRTVQGEKQALFAGWDNGTHSTAMRKHYEGFPNWFDFNWYINHFALNKSYPVFTNCSLDNHPGNGLQDSGDTSGFINRGLDWKVMSDARSEYRLQIFMNRTGISYPVYVDVTPRHYQQFRATGSVYAYNIDADGKMIAQQELTAENGLISVEKFAITSAAGNTLLISTNKKN